jgi:hypothetical protein
MTLLELTIVIVTIMSLVGILFIGSFSWKRGADRTLCLMNINNVQKGIRGYANVYGFSPGSSVPNLMTKIIGVGRYVESMPVCPNNGLYSFGQTEGADTIPSVGTLYLKCSLAASHDHVPPDPAEW